MTAIPDYMFLLNFFYVHVQELEKFISINVLKWSEITLIMCNFVSWAAQR